MSDSASAPNFTSGKDNEFYMSFLTFKVQNVLFKVPAEPFETCSEAFRDMFSLPMPVGDGESSEGRSDDAAIVLEGIEVADFRALLKYLYPKKHGADAQFSQKEWIGIHNLANMWGFEEAKKTSKAFLVDMEDSVLKFELATRYNYDDWLLKAYRELINRPKSLSIDEARRIGLEAASRVAHLREFRLETQLRHQVSHTRARVRVTVHPNSNMNYGQFPCPRCSDVTTYRVSFDCGVTYICEPCGIVFYQDKKAVDATVSGLVDKEIQEVVPGLKDPIS